MGRPLRVAIDLRPLSLGAVTGVGVVIRLILEELEGRGITFVGVTHRPPPAGMIPPSIRVVADPGPSGRIRWESQTLPRLLRQLDPPPDLYHATWNHGLPSRLPFPGILTIHDMIPWRFPRDVTWPKPWWLHHALYRRAIRASARAAAVVLTVSETSRRDIVDLIPEVSPRVEVVPNALPRWFRPLDAGEAAAGGHWSAGSRPRWLYVGGFDPRKGIGTLLLAMRAVNSTSAVAPELILAGAMNAYADQMKSTAAGLKVTARFPGYVPDDELPALFAGASLFLYPSLREGFGIPLLFAMASGVPCIVSDGGSLPEVIGDAGLTFPSGDALALAKLLVRAAADPAPLAVYGARGRTRAALFSPDAFAQRMIRAYERAVESRGASR